MTKRCDRFAEGTRPWSRQVIRATPVRQWRLAAGRPGPISQPIFFHGVRFARSQTIHASSLSSHRSHNKASSASVICRGLGRGRRIRGS
jgi:hypothetical protein